tara:strand:- start:78 stop:488 length:411 start_codon:yes stop_codon:yes gene_type:complete
MAYVPVKGTIVKAGASALTNIGQCTDFSLSIEGAITYDATTIDQSDTFKTYRQSGHAEPGSASISCFYDSTDAGQDIIQAAITASTLADVPMQVTFADSSTIDFDAASISYEISAAGEEGVKVSMEAKCTGDPTFA